ncbi:MAG: MBL fold metallo-hydrolase [Candidatus Pristimantibacillus lignocellulolyticus]|uniref:MBL fold metallo-hydrolase n=1 Tax=Candidatus Pristimantibacillus lignocellulolyticus TaxID=2994561 RepID=A0A9J6ZFD0_9BACL|nr:MAG: MBL fold metallo-hydrolase [Candidatus Pristimantibacillus lignocellulolyticus]
MLRHLKVDVWGGAGEHGRSCYRVEGEELSILLDCGGKKEYGGIYPQIVADQVRSLNSVFLSHAHEDHMAALPLLLQYGYMGDIWLTRETHRQLPAYARAWRSYVMSQGMKIPYEATDWEKLHYRFLDEETQEDGWVSIFPGLRICFGPSGHLPGAVWMLIELEGILVFYSGDYSSESSLLQATMPDLSLLKGRQIDVAIVDAAYGDSPEKQSFHLAQLLDKLDSVHKRGGHVLLPVPLIGRGLDLIVEINEQHPKLPIAAEINLIHEWERLSQWSTANRWLRSDSLSKIDKAISKVKHITGEVDRRLILKGEPHIILSTDGMMLTEPARSYGKWLSDNSKHAIVFTGHLSEDAHMSTEEKCEFVSIRYKIHQGLPDVQKMVLELQPLQVLLVHADVDKTERLITHLAKLGYDKVHDQLIQQSNS